MDNTDIVGGVSPLKQRQKTRGGKYAKKATATSKRRGGFQKAKGEWGGGGRNVGGYNVQTSFTPGPAWVKPANAGSGTTIKPKPTISQELLKNELITEPVGGTIEQTQTLPGEKEVKTEKVPYENWEKACHPDRKAAMIAGLHGLSWNGQAAFDAECQKQKDRMAAPDYKSSGGKTVTKTRHKDGQKQKRTCKTDSEGTILSCGPWKNV